MATYRTDHVVTAWLLVRTVLWTLLLFFTQPTLPLDVLEHLAWGREWRLVYAHHPGLPAWINEALNLATGGSRLALSATAPVSVSLAMAAVWLLAKRVVSEPRALVAMLSLEGIWYFNVVATEFNHNILQLAACAWLFYLTHRAFVGKSDYRHWIALGLVAALSLYAKYSAVLSLLAAFAWSVAAPATRKRWQTPGPWLALTVFVALTVPQIIALLELRLTPLRFALARADGGTKEWIHHIAYPLRFAIAQAGAVLPALLLCILAIGKKHGGDSVPGHVTGNKTDRGFVAVAAFAPLLLALLISAVGGWRFRSMWGAAMVSFIPLWLLMVFSTRELRPRRALTGALSIAALTLAVVTLINMGGPYQSGYGKRIHWPGHEIGQHLEAEWRAAFDAPLRFVAGPKHIAALVSFYAPSRPSAILDGDWEKNFRVTPDEFALCGGIIVWAVHDGKKEDIPPPAFAGDYPEAWRITDFIVDWRTTADIPPLVIGALLVPPRDDNARCMH